MKPQKTHHQNVVAMPPRELPRADWFTYNKNASGIVVIWIGDNGVTCNYREFSRLPGRLAFSLADRDFITTPTGVLDVTTYS